MSALSNTLNTNMIENPIRRESISKDTGVLTDIYNEDINIAIWQNDISDEVIKNINQLMLDAKHLNVRMTIASSDIAKTLLESVDDLKNKNALCNYIELLGDMFCTLFELKRVGLRLTILNQAMCPKFHVDKVPCRLVTTLSGVGTEWLPNNLVDRTKLGAGSLGKPDEISGIVKNNQAIKQASTGDVVLLKGENWFDNENGGVVHRSPSLLENTRRLLLTLDFSD